MKHLIKFTLSLFVVAGLSVQDIDTQPQGAGSCYEVRPICIQGQPVCMCTLAMQCFWACR